MGVRVSVCVCVGVCARAESDLMALHKNGFVACATLRSPMIMNYSLPFH